MKKITFISTSFTPSMAANSVNVMKISDAFQLSGCDVQLLSFTNKNQEIVDLYTYYDTETKFKIKKYKHSPLYYIKSVLFAKKSKSSLVYTRHPLIAYLSTKLRMNTIIHAHGEFNSNIHKWALMGALKSKYLKKFCIASNGLKDVYLEQYAKYSHKMEMISNGVSLKRYRNPISMKEARDAIGYQDHRRLLVYSGSLLRGRGIEIILDIAKEMKDFSFYVVGGSDEQIQDLKKIASNNVNFVGYVENREVYKYLIAADYLLMPYQKEIEIIGGTTNGELIRPLKMFEYIAASKPIIASDLIGLRDVLNDEECIFVSSDNPNEWISAISYLDKNLNSVNRMKDKLAIKKLKYDNLIIVSQILEGIIL